jgi:hypothetical protein
MISCGDGPTSESEQADIMRGNGDPPKLQVQDVHIGFGGLRALQGVSVDVYEGDIVAIIGPNGAGKTTLLNAISGVYHPSQGRILLDGQDRTFLPPSRVAALGIARTFQNVALFRGMSVLDNIMVGRHCHMRRGTVGGIFLGPGAAGGNPPPRQGRAHHRFPGDQSHPQSRSGNAAVRPPETRRTGAGAGRRTEDPPA